MATLVASMLAALTIVSAQPHMDNTYWLNVQTDAHKVANYARQMGYEEDSLFITELQRMWWEAQDELDKMERIIAHLIWYEAGSDGCSDRHQQLVGQVVLNRIRAKIWGNNIVEVIGRQGQYACAKRVFNAYLNDEPPAGITQRCYDNARVVIRGNAVECPPNVIYQAEIVQGSIYEKHYDRACGTTTYFCVGRVN